MRQLRRRTLGEIGESHRLKHLIYPVDERILRKRAAQPALRPNGDVLVHAKVFENTRLLEFASDAGSRDRGFAGARDISRFIEDHAGLFRARDTRNHIQQCLPAHPLWADYGTDLAEIDRERQHVDGSETAELNGDAIDQQCNAAHQRSSGVSEDKRFTPIGRASFSLARSISPFGKTSTTSTISH